MRKAKHAISVFLILCLLLASLPVSALAEEMQELQVLEVFQADEDVAPPEEESIPEQQEEAQATPAEDEVPAELPANLELPVMEELTVTEEIVNTEEPVITEEPEATEEPLTTEEPVETLVPETTMEPLVIEEEAVAEPIELPAVEYIKTGDVEGAEPVDLPILLPEAALPIAEIEGLISDADYWLDEDRLVIAAAWLNAQAADEITLTIHGADMNIYLQPVMLLVEATVEIQPMLSGEYDVSNLFINGVSAAEGSGEGWSYADGVLTIDLNHSDMILSGSAYLKHIEVLEALEAAPFNLTLNSVQIDCTDKVAFRISTNMEERDDIAITIVGENRISAADETFSGIPDIHLIGNGVINVEQPLCPLLTVDGPTVNGTYNSYMYLHSGVVNMCGNDELALTGLDMTGGEVNIRKHADGLKGSFTAIGDFTQLGGTVNIDLSGASSFYGINRINVGTLKIKGGELNINIHDAANATGIYTTGGDWNDGDVEIQLNNIEGTATGIEFGERSSSFYNYARISGGTYSICIDGADRQYGIMYRSYGNTVYKDGGDMQIRLENYRSSACGIYCNELQLNDGNLDLFVDASSDGALAVSAGTIEIKDGSVKLQAPVLNEYEREVILPDITKVPLAGSVFVYQDGEYTIKPRRQLFINGEGYYAYPYLSDISGEDWEYDYDSSTLHLNNFSGESIGFYDACEHFNLCLGGENALGSLELPKIENAEITGNGSLNMVAEQKGYGRAIDAGGNLRISGCTISIQDYADAICAAGSVEISAADIAAQNCRYGISGNQLAIDASSALNLKTVADALYFAETGTLAGNTLELDFCNEIEIQNGEIIAASEGRFVLLNGNKISEADLQQDLSGDEWQWIADEQKLVLGSYKGAIDSSLDFIHVHATQSTGDIAIRAENLMLSAEKGIWVTEAEVEAVNLEVLSGTYVLQDDNALVLESLTVSDGKLFADAGVVAADVKVTGGRLDTATLTADELEILGGSVNVSDSILYYEDENGQVYYGLIASAATVSGGSLYTAEPAFFGSYNQTAGDVEFAKNAQTYSAKHTIAVGASTSFTATGGTLNVHNGYEVAIFAEEITLGGTLTADIYGDAQALAAEKIVVAGKNVVGQPHTTVVLSKGKLKKLNYEEYYGLVIGKEGFTEHMVETMDFSGATWKWEHEERRLTLFDHDGTHTSDIYIYIEEPVNLHLHGGTTTKNVGVYAAGALTVTGDGNYYDHYDNTIYAVGALKMEGCSQFDGELSSNKSITVVDTDVENITFRTTGSVSIKDSMIEDIQIIVNGNISISNSDILSCYVSSGKNMNVTNSSIKFDSWDELYLKGKLTCKNSLVINNADDVHIKGGTRYSSDTAMFVKNKLKKSATLSRSFTLNGVSLEIPSGKTLTLKKGVTLTKRGASLTPESRIKGSGTLKPYETVNLPKPETITVNGPKEIALGTTVQLYAVDENGVDRTADTEWSMYRSYAKMCEFTGPGEITVTSDPAFIGETIKIGAYHYPAHAQYLEFTIVSNTVEVAARDENGRYAESIELWLDPANKTTQLHAKVYPYFADQQVSWKSSNTKVATVSADGLVTAKAAGSASIYAVAADGSGVQSQMVKITVKKAPSSIKFSAAAPVLGYDPENNTGSAYQLKVKLSSGSASTIGYTSSNEAVATVDENGVVTARGAGKATISARTYNGKKASCTVQVKSAPQSISITPAELTIGVGDTYTFKGAIPKNSYGSWFFSTSNANGSINAGTGEFTALKPGDVEVYATTFNGKRAAAVVHVLPAPDVIKLNASSATLGVGEKLVLEPAGETADGSKAAASYIYSSGNKKVATVSADGKITAKKVGKTVVTVTAHNGVTAECAVTVMKAPAKISITPTKLTLAYDAEKQMGTGYRVQGKFADSKTISALSYSSSKPDVAAVSEDGFVTATGVGTAKITVKTFNGKKATCTVTVVAAPQQLSFEQENYAVPVGESVYIGVNNAAGIRMPDYASIASLNTDIVSMQEGSATESGANFTAVAVGETQIRTSAFNGAEGIATVRVFPEPDILTVDETALTVRRGKKYTIVPAVGRTDGQETVANYTFASSNKKVATVSAAGQITAKAKGSATITVVTHNGLTCEIKLKVK